MSADDLNTTGKRPSVRGEVPVIELHAGSATDVVHEYVRRTRGWDRSEYRIDPKGLVDDIERYWIVHVDDEKLPVTSLGHRKSFAVDYDPRKHEVTKEWRFQ